MDSQSCITHVLTPNWDTTLVLRNPNAPFAPWPAENPSEDLVEMDEAVEADPIVFRLSSSHLILASVYFEKMLQGPWSESKSQADGCFFIEASDWDEMALLRLMNIIHGRLNLVPRKISIESLAKMAALVDYYQCHEVTQLFGELWLSATSDLKPVYDRNLALSLASQCVLGSHDVYKISTIAQLFIRYGDGPFSRSSLPINDHLIDQMNATRMKAIRHTIDCLFGLISTLSEATYRASWCESAICAKLFLGNLTSAMTREGILSNKLEEPYASITCDSIFKLMEEILSSSREDEVHSAFTAGFTWCWNDQVQGRDQYPLNFVSNSDSAAFESSLWNALERNKHTCNLPAALHDILVSTVKMIEMFGQSLLDSRESSSVAENVGAEL